jgi:hypothetical protein
LCCTGQLLSDGGSDVVVRDNVNADLYAFVTYEYGRAGNQLANVVLTFVAEGAPETRLVGWSLALSPEHL